MERKHTSLSNCPTETYCFFLILQIDYSPTTQISDAHVHEEITNHVGQNKPQVFHNTLFLISVTQLEKGQHQGLTPNCEP